MIREAVEAAHAARALKESSHDKLDALGRVSPSGIEAALGLLAQGQAHMERLDFSAVDGDEAVDAFEAFRRATVQVAHDSSEAGNRALDQLEPKHKILEFLVELYERKPIHRRRVSSVLVILLNIDSWRAVAEADSSVQAAVRDLCAPRETVKAKAFELERTEVNLKSAAVAAAKRGSVGVLYVRVVAGYNLINADDVGFSDPYVRVTLGRKMKRTEVINDSLNPKWRTDPFVFDVPSIDSTVKFEVLDDDFLKDDPLGNLTLHVRSVQSALKECTRHTLKDVPHGEIELELAFVPAPGQEALLSPSTRGNPWAAAVARSVSSGASSRGLGTPAAPEQAVSTPTAASARKSSKSSWAVWVSVDPRKSLLNFYPAEVAQMLETAWHGGERSIHLGKSFFGATVELRPALKQRTDKGSRDVRRIDVDHIEGQVVLAVVKGRHGAWEAADDSRAAGAQERHAPVPTGCAVPALV